ncbi:MAG: hypothetical protein K2X43_07715 [Hyphomonadaceae bacterium]|jgi:hypothetical protein|nr:hypothetical protein [Hyphomonadaceae bacterium]
MAINQTSTLGSEEAANIAEAGPHGGKLATVFSAVALAFSFISFYMSALQGPELEVYVPPAIHYGRDGGGDTELFAIPITITNSGARSGAVLSMELEVQNLKTNATKRYYSAFLGEHPRDAASPNRQFAPLSIPGRAVFSETVRFYPVGEALPRLVDAQGEYAFRLQLNTATPPHPSLIDRLQGRTQPGPIQFQMTLPWMSDQHLSFRRATIAMHAKDWKPAAAR